MQKKVLGILVIILTLASAYFIIFKLPALAPDDIDLVKLAFTEKYPDKLAANIQLSVQQQTENHMRGLVSFSENPTESEIFLAAKIGNDWQIAFDGSGAIPCATVKNFPPKMVGDCVE